jgi:hypothetical protein
MTPADFDPSGLNLVLIVIGAMTLLWSVVLSYYCVLRTGERKRRNVEAILRAGSAAMRRENRARAGHAAQH